MILRLRHGLLPALAALPLAMVQVVLLASSIFLHAEDLQGSGESDRHQHGLVAGDSQVLTASGPHACPGCVVERNPAVVAVAPVAVAFAASHRARVPARSRRPARPSPRSPSSRAPPGS